MILYNKNKELIGIDEADLKSLGFKNLAAMQEEASDFADLFVKTPGHVHNFKHVHWIDFVLCAKSTDESKAIIHANGKNFKVNLDIKTFYLIESPTTQAFHVSLLNIRVLSSDEKTEIATELQTRVVPAVKVQDHTLDTNEVVHDPYAVIQDDTVNIYETNQEDLTIIDDLDADDITPIEYEETFIQEEQEEVVPEDETNTDNFVFDPQKTAEILEMPVSLIEEFIEDFIHQAIDFKDKFYNAVAADDMIELQALSHKLKGVAANLRVQDALEILTKINKAKDFTTSKKDLDAFYKIIVKLSGEELPEPQIQNKSIKLEVEDEFDDLVEILDEDEEEELLLISDEFDDLDKELDDVIEKEEEEEELLVIAEDFDLLDEAMQEIHQENTDEAHSYDKNSAANEIGIDNSSFAELFDDYISESQNLIMSLENAIDQNNAKQWQNIAIKLKGMSENMRINNFIPQLESLLATNDASIAKSSLEQIQTIIFEILKTKD